jgi:serine protease inhibitor
MYSYSVANGIFVQKNFTIREEYERVVRDVYKSEIRHLDFKNNPESAIKYINE